MFINKAADGRNNLCGRNVAAVRKQLGLSQRELADRLQLCGLSLDKNAVQRIESGQRFVTDIEVVALIDVLGISFQELFSKASLPHS